MAEIGERPPDDGLAGGSLTLADEGRRLCWSRGPDSGQPLRVWSGRALRIACRCAFCERDRRREAREPQPPADLRIESLEILGSTGIRLMFSDGHSRGIYPWGYLLSLPASDFSAMSPTALMP